MMGTQLDLRSLDLKNEESPIIVDPGDSYYVTYSVTVQPEALAVMKSD